MSEITIVFIILALTFSGILCGIHIGLALFFFSLVGVLIFTSNFHAATSLLGTGPFYVLFNYELCVIPLFILMGDFIIMSKASHDLYKAFFSLLKNIKGGLAIATVFSNAVFAALTGVSIASAAVFSKISLPEMEKYGYDKKLTLGTIAGSSVLGMLIPPSVLFITFGIFSEVSIGKLFMAGVIPGIIVTLIYTIGIKVIIFFKPHLAGEKVENESHGDIWETLRVLRSTWSIFALILVVLGGMYAGFVTPTEAGAIGVIGSCLLAVLKGRFKFTSVYFALRETGLVTASFFLLFIGAQLYSRMLAISGFTVWLTELFMGLNVAPIVLILMMVGIWLILGMLIDSISIMVLTLPLMLPIVKALGYDLIWFGVVATISIEMGLLTPPFGMVAFVMKGTLAGKVTITEIFTGIIPFLFMLALSLIIIVMFPGLSTWLPGYMMDLKP